MRLIYEMEYAALVRSPDALRNEQIVRAVYAPLRSARACLEHVASGSGNQWWRHPVAFKAAARILSTEHFFVVDDFLSEAACELLRQAADQSRPEMVRGATGAAGKVLNAEGYTDKLEKTLLEPSRGDVVKFSDDGAMPGCPELIKALDSLVEGLQGCDDVAHRLQYVDWANGAMFSIYPGDSSRYIKHVDNTLGTDGRRLTMILYLNRRWQPSHGGCLRIFEPTMQSFQVKHDVEPHWNRLVVFWSTSEVPHEVLAAYEDRVAVSVWYICGRESLHHPEAFQRLFSPGKLRCIAGRSRQRCLERGAESEAELRALRQFRPDHVFTDSEKGQLSKLFNWRTECQVEAAHETEQDRAIRAAISQALDGGSRPDDGFLSSLCARNVTAPHLGASACRPLGGFQNVPDVQAGPSCWIESSRASRVVVPLHFEVVDDTVNAEHCVSYQAIDDAVFSVPVDRTSPNFFLVVD